MCIRDRGIVVGDGNTLEVPADGGGKWRTVQSKVGKGDRTSISISKRMTTVVTAYVIIMMREERPDGEGATVLMPRKHASAVQCMDD